LASFDYYVTGGNPWGGLAQGGDGNFYGTTTYGGAHEWAGVRMTTNGAITTLASFEYTNGADPYAALTPALTAISMAPPITGGAYGQGTVFKMTTNAR